jgi:cytidylate kinase
VKLWVDAEVDIRGRRRHRELAAAGATITIDELTQQLRERDARDSSRKDAPMKAAADAILIDTTDLTIDAAVDKARAVIEEVMARNE